jgi:ATP-dependent Lhr-like helicase
MGFVTDNEAAEWTEWLGALSAEGRVVHRGDRWMAVDGPTDPEKILLGRLEALGPVFENDPRIAIDGGAPSTLLQKLEHEGAILRTRLEGKNAWCERRLLARIHRYTLDKLRREIEPVSAAEFLQFLACWQHVDPAYLLEGPRGVAEVLRQLAGFEIPAWAWESHVLPRRIRDYRREWLDDVTLMGEFAWGRLWSGSSSAIRITPISIVPRDHLDEWLSLTEPPGTDGLSGSASDLLKPLSANGAMFPQNLQKAAQLVPTHAEMGLAELVSRGLATCDSFGALRQMITPPSRRKAALRPLGRWSLFRRSIASESKPDHQQHHELVARQLLQRTGVVFRRTIMRERLPVNWLTLTRIYRRMELRGEIRGGRFVAGFAGEQFALPQAIELLRKLRREGPRERDAISVVSADPLNFQGILTPENRVSSAVRQAVLVG